MSKTLRGCTFPQLSGYWTSSFPVTFEYVCGTFLLIGPLGDVRWNIYVLIFACFLFTSFYFNLQSTQIKLITYKNIPYGKLANYHGLTTCNFCSKIFQNHRVERRWFKNLCNSLLMGLGQNQQQHPPVHTGGVSRERVGGCGLWR